MNGMRLIHAKRTATTRRLTMHAPTPSSRRHVASPADSAVHAPALVSLARDARAAANDDAVTAVAEHGVNPLWMITAALALFFGAMAIVIVAS
jgi:hypothetical protein